MEDRPHIVDVDDPRTWPESVRAWASRVADQLRGTTKYVSDLPIVIEGEDEFRRLLTGTSVRAFHATRLLDHEVAEIRRRGLRLLSHELMTERIQRAFDESCLTDQERRVLLKSHVFATGEAHGRSNRISLFLPSRVMREEWRGLWSLLTMWGGEAVYMSRNGVDLRPWLTTLGAPAIVVVDLDLSVSWRDCVTYPSLQKLFAGRKLGLEGIGADVGSRIAIGPDRIADVWQPGSEAYDRFPDLPSS